MTITDITDKDRIKRESVVAEARTWIGTPYHKRSMIKGVGADCYSFIAAVMVACGLFRPEDLPVYHDDWFAHQSEEVYLAFLFRKCRPTLESISSISVSTLPGNIAVTRTSNSRIFNHGGIITAWPHILHATRDGVREVNATRDPMWAMCPLRIFDPLEKPEPRPL